MSIDSPVYVRRIRWFRNAADVGNPPGVAYTNGSKHLREPVPPAESHTRIYEVKRSLQLMIAGVTGTAENTPVNKYPYMNVDAVKIMNGTGDTRGFSVFYYTSSPRFDIYKQFYCRTLNDLYSRTHNLFQHVLNGKR